MPAFLEDVSPFIGNGKKNEDGLTLEEYLEEYDASKYKSPSVTADVMVFRYTRNILTIESGLSILMVKRKNHPSIGLWALPGGFCEIGEDLEATAKRELEEETGLTDVPMELINTWGEVWRDPRYRVITASYIALVDDAFKKPRPVAGDDAAEAEWFNIMIDIRGKSVIEKRGKKINRIMYTLILTGPNGEECSAIVSVDENIKGILKERRISVIKSNNIAFDHARFIVDGLLHIQRGL